MKIGISAFAWTGTFTAAHTALLSQVRGYGYTGFEIPMFDPKDLPRAAIRKAFEETGLDCTVCGILPRGINPISPDRAVRERSIAHLVECVDATAEMGGRVLAGPLLAPIGYLPGHRRSPDEWMWAIEAVQSMGDVLTSNSVVLALEPVNRSETFFLRTAAEAKDLCEAVKHSLVGVTVDIFHANIEEKRISDALDHLGPYLKHVHLSENDRGVLGQGHIDIASILTSLECAGFDGYVVVEGFGFSGTEDSGPGALWADESTSPEQLAVESLEHLLAVMASA
jgi:D-psicose/D-tagatose/L-ribulose 3-epimerase